jgi:3-phytase
VVRSRTFLALAVLLIGLPALAQQTVQVRPSAETQPVLGTGAVVQGAALWVHPTDPSNSLLLVADGQTGLLVYQLDGTQRTLIAEGAALGVDVQEGFRVGGISQPLVMVANQSLQGLVAYIVDPTTLGFRGAGMVPIATQGFNPNSVALYASPTTGRFYAFAGTATGAVWQFELVAQADGGAAPNLVRTFNVGGPVVGLAVDDAQRALYVVEQDVALWRYGAEPDAADNRTAVDVVTGGRLVQPGGVALYTASGDGGYLLAANRGADAVLIYDRSPSAQTFRGSFVLVQDGGIDAVERPRHVVVSNRALGSRFPRGMVAVHDSLNTAANENFKLVPWPDIATGFSPALLVDTGAPPDGGTPDGGGADGGEGFPPIGQPPGGPGQVPPGSGPGGSSGCTCASASVPGTVLFVLAGGLLLSRRRRRS